MNVEPRSLPLDEEQAASSLKGRENVYQHDIVGEKAGNRRRNLIQSRYQLIRSSDRKFWIVDIPHVNPHVGEARDKRVQNAKQVVAVGGECAWDKAQVDRSVGPKQGKQIVAAYGQGDHFPVVGPGVGEKQMYLWNLIVQDI